MAKQRIFISFDYDHDEDIKKMLAGQAKHEDSPFDFTDASVKDHLPGDWKGKVKGRLTPGKILALFDQELRNCGMAWAKVRSIKDLAQRVKEKKLHIRKLNKLSDEEVMIELIAVKGIGRWTAEMFLMFTLGRTVVFPDDDLGIRKGMPKLLKKNLSQNEMVEFAERWKPYRTIASWYVWKNLDNN